MRLSLTACTAKNRLSELRRKPRDLLRYIEWTNQIKAEYGSTTNFIIQKRLRWKPKNPDSKSGPEFEYKDPTPFEDPDDFKILPNDWPYGFATDVKHIVVWMKNRLPENETDGDLIDSSRDRVNRFVDGKFVSRLKKDYPDAENRVQWFKNWTKLQSVRALEHIHILLRDVNEDIIDEWTGGDKSISKQV